MKQGPSLAIGRLILYRQGVWGERVAAYWEHGTWTKYMRLVHSFWVEGNPRSQQILMVPSIFLMRRCMPICGAAWWGLQLQWFGVHAVQCVARENCQKESQAYCSLGRADESRYFQCCEPSNQTTQGSTKACKTSCHDAEEDRRTASGCWHMLHHAEYSEYSNESCATTQTANVFFVVFYSYEQESPCNDFSLKSCDG